MSPAWPGGRLPAPFGAVGSSSFVDFLGAHDPSLLPGAAPLRAESPLPGVPGVAGAAPHATTIVAMTTAGGVLMAGDRRATAGSMIAHRDMEKVYPADSHACVGIAGTAGLAVEMVRLFQVELEHYEKLEGAPLSLEGKANRLSTMVRANLGAAMQGLAAIPLLAGYDVGADPDAGQGPGRIYSYDVTGGRYTETDHHAIGSGSLFARGSLKKRWRPGMDESEAVSVALEALLDAADDDSATGGPDTVRGIYPLVALVDADGYRRAAPDDLAAATEALLAQRRGAHGDARRGATQASATPAPDPAAADGGDRP